MPSSMNGKNILNMLNGKTTNMVNIASRTKFPTGLSIYGSIGSAREFQKANIQKMSDPADIACEVLELIKSSSTSKMSSSEETILVKRVWSVLCSQPNTDTESRLQV